MTFTYMTGAPLEWAQMNENLRVVEEYHDSAAISAATAMASANFKGNWLGLSGAMAVPASVRHSGKYWMLLSGVANVAASEPGVNADWAEIVFGLGDVQGPASATAGNLAVLNATGKILSDGGVAPSALMPKTGGTFTGHILVPGGASGAQAPRAQDVVGVTGNQSIAGAKTFSGVVDVTGVQRSGIVAIAALNIDCSAGNYFTKTINGASTFTVSNVPASLAYSFTLELTHTSGAVTWFAGVQWPGGTAPSLTTGKTHLFVFVTDDGGTRWRGAALTNYTD